MRRSLLILLIALSALTVRVADAAAQTASRWALENTGAVIDSSLRLLSARSSGTDRYYFSNGDWRSPNTDCWGCMQGGPTSAAAVLWNASGRTRADLFSLAVAAGDRAVSRFQRADGAFTDHPTGGAGIDNMFFGVEFGTTYLLLRDRLPAATRRRWAAALAASADYLVHSGDISWYANGNLNLGYTELFYIAWKATGLPRFREAYERSLAFTLAPPQDRWRGFGLRILKRPAKADGSDGAGYLAESGSGGIGFDPDYSMLQLDVAARLYLLSGDARVLRLTNLIANALLRHVDERSWMLDTAGGTRHQNAGLVRFTTAGLAVLAWHGGRSDLASKLAGQWKVQGDFYAWAAGDGASPYIYRGFGNSVGLWLMAASTPRPGAARPPVSLRLASAPTRRAGARGRGRASRASKRTRNRAKHAARARVSRGNQARP